MAGDNDAAAAGGLFLVDEVFSSETSFLTGRAKDVGILVGANTAYVDNGVGREDVLLVGLGQPTNVKQERLEEGTHLGSPSGVLSCSAGDELSIAVLEEVFVEAHMLFLCENGVVGLDTVLL